MKDKDLEYIIDMANRNANAKIYLNNKYYEKISFYHDLLLFKNFIIDFLVFVSFFYLFKKNSINTIRTESLLLIFLLNVFIKLILERFTMLYWNKIQLRYNKDYFIR